MSIVFKIYLVFLTITCVIGIIYYKRLRKPYQLLAQMMIFVFLSELLSSVFISQIGSNHPFYHVLQWIQLIYYSVIFSHLLSPKPFSKTAVVLIGLGLAAICCIISFSYQSFFSFPSIGAIFLSLFVIILSLLLFIKMIRLPENRAIYLEPNFWIGSANLIFFSFTFFFFSYYKFLLDEAIQVPEIGYIFLGVANMMMYLFYTIAFALEAHLQIIN